MAPIKQLQYAQVDPHEFRQAMRYVPTPVAVVTAMTEEGPAGVTVGTFTSVSLTPTLVSFLVDVSSTTWPKLKEQSSFAVNILGHDQGELCRSFSRRGEDRFKGIEWEQDHFGNPVLRDASVSVACTYYTTMVIGDHIQVVGEVHDIKVLNEGMPLVFFNGAFLDL